MSGETWAYHCSKCDEIVEVDDVQAHIDAHRRESGWDGILSLTRVDKEPDAGA